MTDTNELTNKKDIGQVLIQQGLVRADQLAAAVAQQKQSGKPLGQILLRMGLLEQEELTHAYAIQSELPYLDLDKTNIDTALLGLIDAATAHKFQVLPIGKATDGSIAIAVGNWAGQVRDLVAKLSAAKNVRVSPAIATDLKIRAAIDKHYGPAPDQAPPAARPTNGDGGHAAVGRPTGPPPTMMPAPKAQLPPQAGRSAVPVVVPQGRNSIAPANQIGAAKASEMFGSSLMSGGSKHLPGGKLDDLQELGVDQPIVIQFVNRILADAINRGASDVHFEPRRDKLDIRYRIDGTLHYVDSIRRDFQAACTSRVKIMADMNISERRLPQDGRIGVTIDGRSIDMRVSSLPTQYGESVVLRILDKGGVRPGLEELGFSDRNLTQLNQLIRKPHGIFLATGPTGSGKTTTLYSAIQAIHTPDVNIITVEDPIEYDLDGIRQSNVHEKAGLTFARQLRAILRQDPDIIYVGEIRDAETAEIAFRAALTGHMVFSTLHCNDAAGAVTRLLNMDVDPFLVSSCVIGVLAQRLVRRVCSKCAVPNTPQNSEVLSFGIDPTSRRFASAHFVKGLGCENCDNCGYRGRYSIQELMVMDDDIRTMVLQRAPSNKIRQTAMAHGMVPMRDDAAEKIMQGITTFEEASKRVYIEQFLEEVPPV